MYGGGQTGYVPNSVQGHYVTQACGNYDEDDGYLVLKEGQVVFVEYIGCDGQEQGWLYGYKSGSEDHHGWFPEWCIKKNSPQKMSRAHRAPASPLQSVSNYVMKVQQEEKIRAVDTFARIATPPPDDEEEDFHRQMTPPPDDDDDICPRNLWLPPEPTALPAAGQRVAPPPPPARPVPVAPKGRPMEGLPVPGLEEAPARADYKERITQGLLVGKNLPMYQFCAELKQKLLDNRVVMVDAATGSGKSTLVPLCLAEQCLEEGRSCRIVVTQPRRMAAKKLAERVADQAQSSVGDLIGYRVGGRDKRDHPQGLIVYVTVGHFLEALVHNPSHLDSYSHVVLDEVHERFVEADFLMALLRILLSRPHTLKTRIVVMSATLQKALHAFFKPVLLPFPHRADMVSITSPGTTPFKVEDFFFDDLPADIKRGKTISFGDLLPDNLKSLKRATQRSDKLTGACQKMVAIGAKWICSLYQDQGINVVLAFLPGFDQMKELKNQLTDLVKEKQIYEPLIPKPDIILMHSALDEVEYRRAGDPEEEGQWKVVIATNMAESSLTLPNVGAVIDFGMHRVNEYNDESKMSTLVTTWCSKASLKQRRGRTGRTNDGKYYCMMERRVYEKLEDYDQSGVERSSLTKVALEAAYLADVLSRPPQILAGLPVLMPSQEGLDRRLVQFFDGEAGLWRIAADQGQSQWAAEEDLQLAELRLDDVLNLLPSPPKIDRIVTAIGDLQEFGTLTMHERPTALGIACLKLPTEVHLARLVVLGWTMGIGPSACVLAAALSLTPSCDVFQQPMPTQSDLDKKALDTLKYTIQARAHFDDGWLSEPLTIYSICLEWLKRGGGLGSVPNIDQWKHIHQRLWTQFSTKVVDLWRSLQRLVPPCDRKCYDDLRTLQNLARGSRWREDDFPLEKDKEKLLALLTWGLAPGSFIAVGQSPSIYGKGSYGGFWTTTQECRWPLTECLYWKRPIEEVKNALDALESHHCVTHVEAENIKEVQHEDLGDDEKSKRACVVLVRKETYGRKTYDFDLLYRLCSPFNGKAWIGNEKTISPVHPCAFNWYMPYRQCDGLKEVCLNWKSPAYSLLNTQRRPQDRCRPKRFLVASGGDYRTDYHGDTKTRVTMLRGISVLPDKDGGRQALLWFLAAGVPRDARMIALCAPQAGLDPKDFEIRGLWMWERTIRLPNSAIITSHDLELVNRFRSSLRLMQSYQPHRLAGTWHDVQLPDEAFRIDCLEDVDEGHKDILCISKLRPLLEEPRKLHEEPRKLHEVPGGWALAPTEACVLQELPEGLRYGERMLKRSTEELAILEQFNPESLEALRSASEKLLEVSKPKEGKNARGPWPGRLVPLCSDTAMSPIDLKVIHEQLTPFCRDLQDRYDDFYGFASQEEEEKDAPSDDEDYVDKSLEHQKVNKGFMWTLAESDTFDLNNCEYLQLPENSLALPTAATCAMCEQEGKTFSKRQLANPIHNRLCQDCVLERTAALQGNAYVKPEKIIVRAAGTPMPKLVQAAQQPKVCSVCKQLLDESNSTSTQRTKPTSKRKCQACATKPGAA